MFSHLLAHWRIAALSLATTLLPITAAQAALGRAPQAVASAAAEGAPAARQLRTAVVVPDPEVPVVSVVELGIVRDVSMVDGRIRIAVTPTYSGCPATEAIERMIRERIAALGVGDVEVVTWLAPPWTTDWLAPEGKRKLAAFGIAPPHVGAQSVAGGGSVVPVDVRGLRSRRRAEVMVPCPRCGSAHTSLLSQFGSTACKAQYRCDDCREPFDYFKPH